MVKRYKKTETVYVDNNKLYKIRSGYGMNFICCDCGLVHRLWMKASGRSWIEFMVVRDNRGTSARRRGKALRQKIKGLLRKGS